MVENIINPTNTIPHNRIEKWRIKEKKCVVVGDTVVGKTTLLMTYSTNKFPTEYDPNLFINDIVVLNIGREQHDLCLFDTAGQEDYERLRSLVYSNTDVFLACFSVVDPYSFERVKSYWMPKIARFNKQTPFLLVGTKIDQRDDPKIINELGNIKRKTSKKLCSLM
ncbi:cell division control protein 42 homolog [Arctopsyche grandis]|uniref:cell division control protein 42 homolog n=1 Tax=Arctopsyche grandis TaxID=121162 RepID=UPI00406D7596